MESITSLLFFFKKRNEKGNLRGFCRTHNAKFDGLQFLSSINSENSLEMGFGDTGAYKQFRLVLVWLFEMLMILKIRMLNCVQV